MKNRMIDILIDFAFKRVFAGEGEESKRILKDFLNSLLELKGIDRIEEITYLNPFNDREHEQDKQSIMDIKVATEAGEKIDIEVQINNVDNYKKRSLYYWSKLYAETINKGDAYYNLKKSIVINIVNFDIIEESKKYHSIFVLKEKDENYQYNEDLEMHFIELPKFNIYKDVSELNDLEEWITFFKECGNENNEDIINKLSKNKEEIRVATDIIRKLSADEIAYEQYLAREKYLQDEFSKKAYAQHEMKIVTERAERAERAEQAAKQAEQTAIKAAEQAIFKTRREDIIENLSELGEIPISIINTVNKEVSVDLLKKWAKISAKAESIDEFINKMQVQ